jgi:DNA invertase Pin-like site-specific DNA recombinase
MAHPSWRPSPAPGCATVVLDEQVRLTDDRPQLDHALAAAPAGGTLIVCQLTQLGRSLAHLVDLLTDLERRGVRLRSLDDHIDTAEHGELLRRIAHGLLEARHVWRSETTKDGPDRAVAAGRKLGRRSVPVLSPRQEELARRLQATGHSATDIATLLGISRPTTLYRALPAQRVPSTAEDSAP